MKETPILFSAEMVRAILAGRKTQTRRVVKPLARDGHFYVDHGCNGWWPWRSHDGKDMIAIDAKGDPVMQKLECPYGVAGDRLWVRERHSIGFDGQRKPILACPLGDAPDDWVRGETVIKNPDREEGSEDWCLMWYRRPSIHMPRWASRITLEITGVRVQRIQDINHDDVLAEGIEPTGFKITDQINFMTLWDNINARRGFPWDDEDGPPPGLRPIDEYWPNPWVWVIEFKRLT